MTTSRTGTSMVNEAVIQKSRIVQVYSNMYTGLLALTTLALLGTIAFVCFKAWQMYEQVFWITSP